MWGNWPGVTVEQKLGVMASADGDYDIIDLPGIYSAIANGEIALDERIACDYLASGQAGCIINVVDASNLERHLYLTLQLLALGLPVMVALNMMDVAKKRGIQIDQAALQRKLGVPRGCLGIASWSRCFNITNLHTANV